MPAPVVAGAAAKEILKQIALTAAVWGASKMLDAAIQPGPHFDNPDPGTPIPDQPPSQIVNNITIRNDNESSAEQKQDTQIALNTLAATEENGDLLVAHLKTISADVSPELDAMVANSNDDTIQQLKHAGIPKQNRNSEYSEPAQKVLRKVKRADTDRWYCSKEEHEYRYCSSKGKIQQVYDLASITRTNVGTYGTWVNEVDMRKAIAFVRKLKRLSHGKNSTAITEQLGTDRDALLESLASSAEAQAILAAGANAWE